MVLIDRTGFTHDHGTAFDGTRQRVLASDSDVTTLAGELEDLDLLVIEFPSNANGRGFSLARRLRNLGYEGELRARGPLIADQFDAALRCGFDTVEVPAAMADRQPESQWLAALHSIGDSYQPGYGPSSILERRMAASRQ